VKVIPIKLSDSLTAALDELVKSGFYVSRNDAVRDAIRRLVEGNRPTKVKDSNRLQVELQSIARVVSAILLNKYGKIIS
jgi:Arc/MetJ-type ribon-helix-helix transcriptional regulator